MTYKSHLLWAVLAGSASWAAVQVVPLPGVGRLPVGGANEFMLWMAAVGFRLFANGGFAEAALNVVASSAAFYAWWHLH